jgi:hypothetical protein
MGGLTEDRGPETGIPPRNGRYFNKGGGRTRFARRPHDTLRYACPGLQPRLRENE